jgi:quinol monooxygenase YgiN
MPKSVKPIPPGPQGEAAWYAKDQKISIAEARKRQDEQNALRPRFEKLMTELRAKEAGNYTDARVVHQPDWAYVLFFKRNPDATLAKYISHAHFKAALAPYTREELDALVKPWADRFTKANIVGGYGSDATYGTAEFMMSVTEEEYREIAEREGWGPVPTPIKLGFAQQLAVQAVDPKVAPLLRHFASERRATVFQLEALGTGRIILRDGCLRVVGYKGQESLAMFHKETGIGLDSDGYVALINRGTGKPAGRIGEMFAWGAPNNSSGEMPEVIELRAECGSDPVVNVGNPESKTAFDQRYSRR